MDADFREEAVDGSFSDDFVYCKDRQDPHAEKVYERCCKSAGKENQGGEHRLRKEVEYLGRGAFKRTAKESIHVLSIHHVMVSSTNHDNVALRRAQGDIVLY